MRERHSEAVLEKRFMTQKRRNIYIALEELDFTWGEDQVLEVIEMWNDDVPLIYIADHFDRKDEEVGVLIMDLALKDKIKARERGI
jgi:hypothetical protein